MILYFCTRSSPQAGVTIREVMGVGGRGEQCHCRVLDNKATISSVSRVLEVTFRADLMTPKQDFRNFGVKGSFRFISSHCQDQTREKRGGLVTLEGGRSDQICDRKSW